MAKLKLFRANSGFRDSYVAATSRSAALKAWGARTDLFEMGAAEQVNDPAILEEASKKPGTILQRKRAVGGKLETRARAQKGVADKTKLKRAYDAAAKKLAAEEAERDAERKKLDDEIERLTAKREKAVAMHDRIIAKSKEILSEVHTKLED